MVTNAKSLKSMSRKDISIRELPLCGALAALSAIAQLIHIGYQGTFIWIDFVAVPWVIAFFLLGIRAAIITSSVGFIIITLFAPTTWLGASMKWIETMPMWLILYLWLLVKREYLAYYQKYTNIIIPTIIALVMRSLLALPLNYYYAIPIYLGLTHSKAFDAIPWYLIVFINIAQGLFDAITAWILVFRFKLARFSSWEQ